MPPKLLQQGADPNITFKLGRTALHSLCVNNASVDILKLVLSKVKNLNAPDKMGKTPLCYLCEKNADINSIKLFLEAGGSWNILTNNNKSPFERFLEGCEANKDYRKAVEFLCHIPKKEDNTIELIINDDELLNTMKTLPLPSDFKDSFDLQTDDDKKSVFTFYCSMYSWRKDNKHKSQWPAKGVQHLIRDMICSYFPKQVIIKNSNGEVMHILDPAQSNKIKIQELPNTPEENKVSFITPGGKVIEIRQDNSPDSEDDSSSFDEDFGIVFKNN